MTDSNKTKKQLIQELQALRQRVHELEGETPPSSGSGQPLLPLTEDRIRQVVEKSPIGMVISDAGGQIRTCNPAFGRMLGYSQQELRHVSLADISHPDDVEFHSPPPEKTPAGAFDNYEFEKRFLHKGGAVVWGRVGTTVLSDNAGRPIYYVDFIQDITEKKADQERLSRRREAELAITAISTAFINMPIDQVDSQVRQALEHLAKFAGVESAYLRLFGEDGAAIVDSFAWDGGSRRPESVDRSGLTLSSYPWFLGQLQQGRPVVLSGISNLPQEAQAERQFFSVDGLKSTLVMPLIANGKLAGYLGFSTWSYAQTWADEDIALLRLAGEILINALSRKQTKKALLEGHRLLHTLIDAVPDPVYVKDSSGRFLVGNKAVARVMGVDDPQELVGRNDYSFYPKHLATKYAADEAQVIASGEALVNREEVVTDQQTGEDLWVLTSKVPVRDAADQVIGLVGIGHDITQRKRAEESLRQAHAQLEKRVCERTAQLSSANEKLLQEIGERLKVEDALRRSEQEKETILNGLQGHVTYFDKDLTVRWVNKPMLDYIGKSQAEAVGRPCYDIMWGHSDACPECPVVKAMQTRKMCEYERATHDGMIWSVRGFPIIDETGQVVGGIELSVDITERKLMELQIRESEEKFRQFVSQSSDGILLTTGDGRIVEWNDSAAAISGLSREEVMGKTLWDVQLQIAPPQLHTPETLRQFEANIREFLGSSGTPGEHEHDQTIQRPDGTQRVIQSVHFPIRVERETMLGAVWRDITSRVEAGREIQHRLAAEGLVANLSTRFINLSPSAFEDEIRYALQAIAAFAAVDVCFLALLDTDSTNVTAEYLWVSSDAYAAQPQVEVRGSLSMSPFAWIMSELRQGRPVPVPNMADLPAEAANEKALWRSHGVTSALALPVMLGNHLIGFWGFETLNRQHDWSEEDTNLLGLVSEVFAGLLARHWGEEALQASEDRYRQLIEFSPNMIGITIGGEIRFINSNGARMLGAETPSQLIGRPIIEFVHPDNREEVEHRMQLLQSADSSVAMVEEKWLRLDGTALDVVVAAVPVTFQNQPAIQVVSYDITERNEMAREAMRSERMAALGRLSASLAHEINNPLQIVRSHLDLVLDFPLGNVEKQEYLEIVRDEIDRISAITRNVLDLARPRAGKQPVSDAEKILANVLALTRNETLHQQIQVITDFQPVPPVRIFQEHLQQICLNLMLNAIEAVSDSPEKRIRLGLKENQDRVEVSFANTGPPIPKATMEHLFEPYYSTKPDGSGLGLWVSYNLLKDYGSLSVDNLSDNQGTVFTVTLDTTQNQAG